MYKECIWSKRGEKCLLKTQCKQAKYKLSSMRESLNLTSHQHLTTRLEETKTPVEKHTLQGHVPRWIQYRNNLNRLRRNPRNFPDHELLQWVSWIPDQLEAYRVRFLVHWFQLRDHAWWVLMSIQYVHYFYPSGFFSLIVSSGCLLLSLIYTSILFILVASSFFLDTF